MGLPVPGVPNTSTGAEIAPLAGWIFRVDVGTTVTGAADAVTFSFQDAPLATIRISQSSIDGKKTPIAENLPVYQKAATSLVPPGSTDVVLLGQKENVYAINEWTSVQYSFKYNYYGRALLTSITFLNYNKNEQWIVNATSPEADLEKTARRESDILNSLHETDVNFRLEDAPN